MTSLHTPEDPPTADDLRDLEARMEARFAAVAARFIDADRHMAFVDMRLDELPVVSQKIDRLGRIFVLGVAACAALLALFWLTMLAVVGL